MIRNLLFRFSLLLMSLLLLQGCSEDSDEIVSGKIFGTVRDEISGILLGNCTVTVDPSNQSMVTENDGKFEFTGLESGTYSLTFNRPGYEEKTLPYNLVVGLHKKMDVSLKGMEGFSLSEKVLNFGDLENSKSFHLVNNSAAECTYSISEVPEWLELSTVRGDIEASSAAVVNATVKRESVPYGNYNSRLTVTFKGSENVKLYLDVKMQKVEKSAPTVTIGSEPSKTSLHSLTIKGMITSTGGSKITRHGHCWSTTANPTLDNDHSDLGQREATGEFTSDLENLTPNTTYYIRSYAVNAQGVSYSQQIMATTDDAASDKWDGTKATEFSGGSGIMGDPYLITTGAQLNLVRDYSSSKFKLMNNINLDKRAWKPISDFSGEFDGNGFTIFNLKVETGDTYSGSGSALFNKVSGSTALIKNLHINGVNIENKDWGHVAALVGTMSYGSTLEDCTVTLNEHSKLLGKSNVGGLVADVASSNVMIKNCKVTGSNKEGIYQILGEKTVGGLVGYNDGNIVSCHVVCGVSGNQYIGGVSGYDAYDADLSTSSFTGRLLCEKLGGGISGRHAGVIRGCKVNADIKGTEVGGIAARGDYDASVISCYYQGKLEGLGDYSGLILSDYEGGKCYACYAVPDAGSTYSSFGGKVNEDCASTAKYVEHSYTFVTNTVGDCANILEHFKTIGEDYQADWDFENVWEKETMVNGSMTTVKCPKLLWEE